MTNDSKSALKTLIKIVAAAIIIFALFGWERLAVAVTIGSGLIAVYHLIGLAFRGLGWMPNAKRGDQ